MKLSEDLGLAAIVEAVPKFRVLGLLPRLMNIRALIIKIRLWGPLYHTYNKEPPK